MKESVQGCQRRPSSATVSSLSGCGSPYCSSVRTEREITVRLPFFVTTIAFVATTCPSESKYT